MKVKCQRCDKELNIKDMKIEKNSYFLCYKCAHSCFICGKHLDISEKDLLNARNTPSLFYCKEHQLELVVK